MKPILFLDFDGVINTHRSLIQRYADHYGVDYTDDDFSEKYWDEVDGVNPELIRKIDRKRESGEYRPFGLSGDRFPFDDKCISNCNTIINENGADICVTSTWRLGRTVEQLQELLNRIGVLGVVVGKTGNSADRAKEIYEWIKGKEKEDKEKITNICILDDDHAYDIDYMFSDYTVKDINSKRHGLRKKHISEAKSIFEKPFDVNEIDEYAKR